ncbi:MAG: hydroxymethylbilane synthase [Candidatus Eisenbacteria bacterium]|uniref:Porphobilinogen deaminase n=1 Tax=Eiseniibacteriota bacterium TaxID=2212470 RepID=A0A956RMS4_UNCEI|nr:hydroxymethylbilane synthase [Candidatus Eisenbacteria bacterium]
MKTARTFRIGTRGSDLALWQAQRVQTLLRQAHPDVAVEVEIIETRGDRDKTHVLYHANAETAGLFTKNIEGALLEKRVDIAVHSLKDLPTESPKGLMLGAIPERADVHDLWITRDGSAPEAAPPSARIGTSSLRRRAMLSMIRADYIFGDIRGNVPRRLQLLEEGKFHAIILAAAGLARLEKRPEKAFELSLERFLPAPGQGAMAVQIREDDAETMELVHAIDDPKIRLAVYAERSLLHALEGGCSTPIGALAAVDGPELHLRAMVVEPTGSRSMRGDGRGGVDLAAAGDANPERRQLAWKDAERIGEDLAAELLRQGARELVPRQG